MNESKSLVLRLRPSIRRFSLYSDFAKECNQIKCIKYFSFVRCKPLRLFSCIWVYSHSVQFIYSCVLYTHKIFNNLDFYDSIASMASNKCQGDIVKSFFFHWSVKIAINIVDMFWCCCCVLLPPFYLITTKRIQIKCATASVRFFTHQSTALTALHDNFVPSIPTSGVFQACFGEGKMPPKWNELHVRKNPPSAIHPSFFTWLEACLVYYFHVTSKCIVSNIAYIFIGT